MIHTSLNKPGSVAIIGASDNQNKPGAKLIENLLNSGFEGDIYPVNPNKSEIQGLKCYQSVVDLPETDLGVLAIDAEGCVGVVEEMASKKGTRAFIIISAGFGESGKEGIKREKKLQQLSEKYQLTIIGPNCIGILTQQIKIFFTSPLPQISDEGCDFVSASGAFAVFLFEMAAKHGLRFSSVYSVGNSINIGVEEILEYWDQLFDPNRSSRVKLFYIEQFMNPLKFLKHAQSLHRKGCRLVGISAGSSKAGNRAVMSHTGAMADSESAISALMEKAGVIQVYSRLDFLYIAMVLNIQIQIPKRIGILTHAGGPAVMLVDELSKQGFEIPQVSVNDMEYLREILHPGASVNNPIDILATGKKEQMSAVLDYYNNANETTDAIIVIYGRTGLEDLNDTYTLLAKKVKEINKSVFVVAPSVSSSEPEMKVLINDGIPVFSDEVILARTMGKVIQAPQILETIFDQEYSNQVNQIKVEGDVVYLSDQQAWKLLTEARLPVTKVQFFKDQKAIEKVADELYYPLVLKASGLIHKSDEHAVILNIQSKAELLKHAAEVLKLNNITGLIIQPYHQGFELFIGVKFELHYGHIIMFGLGGVNIEVYKDVSSCLLPVSEEEIISKLRLLRGFPLMQGYRGKKGINIRQFASVIMQVAEFIQYNTDIDEMDLNPLIATSEGFQIVDVRISKKQ